MYSTKLNQQVLLTICVPVYATQVFLPTLLSSIQSELVSFNRKLSSFLRERFSYIEQDEINELLALVAGYETLFEVIIVDDGTQEKNAKKAIYKRVKEAQKDFKKNCDADLILIEHSRN